jgi:hypothetical protein
LVFRSDPPYRVRREVLDERWPHGEKRALVPTAQTLFAPLSTKSTSSASTSTGTALLGHPSDQESEAFLLFVIRQISGAHACS